MNDSPDKNLVPRNSSEVIKSSVDLINQAAELLSSDPNVVTIPAHPSKKGVRILPQSGYFSVDHGIKYFQVVQILDLPVDNGTNPSFYAAYLMQIDGSNEMRFVTMPVSLFPGKDAYNNELVGEMERQGFPPDLVRANCQLPDVQQLYGYLDVRYLPSFRFLTQGRRFLTEGSHADDRRWILLSGWKPRTFSFETGGELTIIGDPVNQQDKRFFFHQGLYNSFDQNTLERYNLGSSDIHVISNPVSVNTIGEFETAILEKVIAANRK